MASLLDLFAPLEPEEDSEISSDEEAESEADTHHFEQDSEEEIIEPANVRGPVYSTPDHNDPGQAYIEISETEGTEAGGDYTNSPSTKQRKSLFTLFQHDTSSDSDEEEYVHRNSKYTFNNTVVGSYRDELAQEMQREVEERFVYPLLRV